MRLSWIHSVASGSCQDKTAPCAGFDGDQLGLQERVDEAHERFSFDVHTLQETTVGHLAVALLHVPDGLLTELVELVVVDVDARHVEHPPRHVVDKPPRPVEPLLRDERIRRVLAHGVEDREAEGLFRRARPERLLGRRLRLVVESLRFRADSITQPSRESRRGAWFAADVAERVT